LLWLLRKEIPVTPQVGDTVRLKSGNKRMTVKAIVDDDLQFQLGMNESVTAEVGDILCEWYSDGKIRQAAFRAAQLEVVQKATDKP
jgi:uncharacterized protein YodC (DUF2158 family)